MADVLTQHNDNARTGANPNETVLTIATVHGGMKQRFNVPIDPPRMSGLDPNQWTSQIVAQPLYVSNVSGPATGAWPDGVPATTNRDILVIVTMHGTVYAYDPSLNFDPAKDFGQVWARWLGPPVLDSLANGVISDNKDWYGTNPEWGILSTPVIDPVLKRLYVVAWNKDGDGAYRYRLHALDLNTGDPPTSAWQQAVIGGNSGAIAFDPAHHKQRPGLLLVKPSDLTEVAPSAAQQAVGPDGTLYIAFGASDIDRHDTANAPFHGWVFAYDVGPAGFIQRAVWCSTPNSDPTKQKAGVWQSGAGLTADRQGNVYLMTGDGDFTPGGNDYGGSFVKLSCRDLSVLDSFTPWDWQILNDTKQDLDLGSSGPMWIPGTNFVVGAGKPGILYCLDRTRMGGVGNATTKTNNDVSEVQATKNPPFPPPNTDPDHHVHGSPVYFQPLNRLYLWGENDVLRAFEIDRTSGQLSGAPVAWGQKVAPNGMPGGMLSLSANGANDAIIWALLPFDRGTSISQGSIAPPDPSDYPTNANQCRLVWGVLRAFDAMTLQEIWNSEADLFYFAKFAPPTIANGRVYVPTYGVPNQPAGQFLVYGL